MSERLPLDHCPVCRHRIDAVTPVEGEKVRPVAGDVTVCLYCTTFMEFGVDLRVTAVSLERFRTFDEGTRDALLNARHAILLSQRKA